LSKLAGVDLIPTFLMSKIKTRISSCMNFKALKQRHREQRKDLSENLNLRVHRALSWLDRAEQAGDDTDAKFIFLWIAFNAAYANEVDDVYRKSEQQTFRDFIDKLCSLDEQELLTSLVWREFHTSIQELLDNKYVFRPFWDYQNGKIDESEWQSKFQSANYAAQKSMESQNTEAVLSIVFSRLYMLRNQLLHGGATWNSQTNRLQINDGAEFLSKFIPYTIDIMLSNGNKLWGDACFPVVD
jgi:hypothetical protein